MKTYSGLDEPDGLSGLACLHTSLSLQDQLSNQQESRKLGRSFNFFRAGFADGAYLSTEAFMCHFQTMVIHVDGLIAKIHKYKKT